MNAAVAKITEIVMHNPPHIQPANDACKPLLELKNVNKSYGEGRHTIKILKDINLDIHEGEFIAIVGFSGSGKTTLVSLIAGLIAADTGELLKNGQLIQEPGPDRGVVFQNYSLMPWLTVYQNVALAVDAIFKDWTAEQRRLHTEKYIHMVNLGASNGQKACRAFRRDAATSECGTGTGSQP